MKSILLSIILTHSLFAGDFFKKVEIDEKETVNKVKLRSGKRGDNRYYEGNLVRTFNTSITSLRDAILAFDQRCNNEYLDKREILPKDKKCKYHNNNVIENMVHKELKSYEKEENETGRLIISRRIYNREDFSQSDVIKIYEYKLNDKKVIKITMEMIDEKEAAKYIKPLVKTVSAFNKSQGTFLLTELSPGKVELDYTYSSRTDHWLINKSIAAGEVFESVAKSLNSLFDHLNTESQELMAKK